MALSKKSWDQLLQKAATSQSEDHYLPDLLKKHFITAIAFQKQLTQILNTKQCSNTQIIALLDCALTCSILSYTEQQQSTHSKQRKDPRNSNQSEDSKLKHPVVSGSAICSLLTCWSHYLNCDELPALLNYLFSRTTNMCRISHFCRVKNEVPFLKFANAVLNRITDIELAGHWMVFMANFVDIDSRSGQNHLGNFNLSNITRPDESEDLTGTAMVDRKLYSATWQIQDVFRDPQHLAEPKHSKRLQTFKVNLDLVLETFKKNPISDSVAAGHFATRDSGYAHCKYLTSRRLFTKQLHNPSFRRAILVQALIFLKSHSVEVPFSRPKLSPMAKFNANDQQWFQERYTDILNRILPSIPPGGTQFKTFITRILERDENWLIWKYNEKLKRCSDLKKPPIPLPGTEAFTTSTMEPATKRRKLNGNKKRMRPRTMEYLDEETFLNRHKRRNKKAKLMGDSKLGAVFEWMPSVYRSRRNVDRHWRDEVKGGDKGLSWLKGSDYASNSIDFKERLEDRLTMMVEDAVEKKNVSSVSYDERTIFTNLRIMRQYKWQMFSDLVPMAKVTNPDANNFKSNFMLNALKIHDPEAMEKAMKMEKEERIKKEKEMEERKKKNAALKAKTKAKEKTDGVKKEGKDRKERRDSKDGKDRKETAKDGKSKTTRSARSSSKSRSRAKDPPLTTTTPLKPPPKSAITATPSSGRSTVSVHISRSSRSPNRSNRDNVSNGSKKDSSRHRGNSSNRSTASSSSSSSGSASSSSSSSGLDALDPLDCMDVAVSVVS